MAFFIYFIPNLEFSCRWNNELTGNCSDRVPMSTEMPTSAIVWTTEYVLLAYVTAWLSAELTSLPTFDLPRQYRYRNCLIITPKYRKIKLHYRENFDYHFTLVDGNLSRDKN